MYFDNSDSTISNVTQNQNHIEIREEFLFDSFGVEGENYEIIDGIKHWKNARFSLKPNTDYSEMINDGNTVFITPIFTSSAYESPGFYDYYNNRCDESCLSVKLQYSCRSESSCNAVQILDLLGYDMILDYHIDIKPEILKQYDTVIVLHNEYVTQTEFDAIMEHPNVIYLYPNSNYGLISAEYTEKDDNNLLEGTVKLIRGHGYPEENITNGFDWELDNSAMEYNAECKDWEFYDVDNGKMLNCYPEILILKDKEFLEMLKSLSS